MYYPIIPSDPGVPSQPKPPTTPPNKQKDSSLFNFSWQTLLAALFPRASKTSATTTTSSTGFEEQLQKLLQQIQKQQLWTPTIIRSILPFQARGYFKARKLT